MEPLSRKPSLAFKHRILQSMFRFNCNVNNAEVFDIYFEHYESELLKALHFRRRVTAQSLPSIAANSHEDILNAVQILRSHSHQEKKTLRHDLMRSSHQRDSDAVNGLIEIAVRLWLMLNVRQLSATLHAPQTPVLLWHDEQSLTDVIASIFPEQPKWSLEAKDSRIDPSFTASFMVEVCGLKLEWTTCLADHLRLDRRAKALRVFPYKSILKAHLEMSWSDSNGVSQSPLPTLLLQESIWSLNLLFPHWDRATNQLLTRHGQNFETHGPYDFPPTLNFIDFHHWRDRLLELHDLIFVSPPVSWAQLWRDRRNPQQFWTFWIALVILALTLVSTVASVVQAWASIKSLQAT